MKANVYKQSLYVFSIILALLHLLLGILQYFIDISILQIIDYILAGVLIAALIPYIIIYPGAIRLDTKQGLLVAILIWYFFSCASMQVTYHNNWFLYNLTPLFDTAMIVFLFFPLGRMMAKTGTIRIAEITLHIALSLWSVFLAYVLVHVFQNQIINTPNGGQIGMSNWIALRLNCHSNTTGAFEVVFFTACLSMIFVYKNPIIKILYVVESIINYVVLVLSKSRTAFIAVSIGSIIIVGVGIYKIKMLSGWTKKRRTIFAISGAIVYGVAFYGLYGRVFDIHEAITHLQELLGDTGSIKNVEDVSFTLTGRTTIWKYAIQGMCSSLRAFFFGVTPVSVNSLISLMSNGQFDMYTHNQLLEVGVSLGFPALCMFSFWFISVLHEGYLLLRKADDVKRYCIVLVFILILFLANMAEATLLFYRYVSSYAFFFLCGLLSGYYEKQSVAAMVPRRIDSNTRKGCKK